ncbi:MAG: hypothetical protein ACLPOO_19570 [Terriglobales bacterium]
MKTTELTLDEARAVRDASARHRDELRERSNELTAAVDDIAGQLKRGCAVADVNAIGAEKYEVDRALLEAEGKLEHTERELAAVTASAQHERLHMLVDRAQAERLAFIEHFRAAALALGNYCQAVGEALVIGTPLMDKLELRLPIENTLMEILEQLEPTAGWLAPRVFEQWHGWGYQLSFSVGPVVKIELGEN